MVASSATSGNVELAMKMLEYAYSEEGHMFFNFGTEGVSYTMEDGYPKFIDLLMKNPISWLPHKPCPSTFAAIRRGGRRSDASARRPRRRVEHYGLTAYKSLP